ncbi:MAG: M55 family metallopeptidase [bacterium]|nr:M55 family metallopeptidase [bacterium]
MNVYVSVDMEGISGVADWRQTDPGKDSEDYDHFRALMAQDVNAAVEGALAAGATGVLVNDSHGSMRNVLVTAIHPRAELISGSPKRMSMVEGLDASFQAVFMVGYHSRAGSPGVLNHTYSSRVLAECRFNDRPLGETGLNAAVAGHFGVPVLLVTGDDVVAREAADLLTGVRTVVVKQALGRYAARCLHPERTRDLIREAAGDALAARAGARPYLPDLPLRVELDFNDSGHAEAAELLPAFERTGERTLAFTAADALYAYRMARVAIRLAAI